MLTPIDGPAPDPVPSSLSQLHPDHAGELARFLSLKAGWTAADLDLLDGDPAFTAEVQAAMRALKPAGGAQ